MTLLNWLSEHWFDSLQTIGIVASLYFAGSGRRRETRVHHLQNVFALTKQHRDIWSSLYTNPELARIFDANADLVVQPVTNQEEVFVKFLIFHLVDAHRALKEGLVKKPEGLGADIHDFFSCPIPDYVWGKYRRYQDKDFIEFMEEHRK